MPKKFGSYHEPFVGGGALFFELQRAFGDKIRYVLGDTNRDLIVAYREVRDQPGELLRRLRAMQKKNTEAFYYRVRDFDIESIDPLVPGADSARAARMIYLNKTCFNGLHRVNRAGRFNVPYGYRVKPNIADEIAIGAASRALQGSTLRHCSFVETAKHAARGDFVYFDPPYMPLSETSNFTAYGSDGFGWTHHVELYRVAGALKARGVHVLISNSANPRIMKLYKNDPDFKVETIEAARSINATGHGRGKIKELIIT